jgi:hypothetical protein
MLRLIALTGAVGGLLSTVCFGLCMRILRLVDKAFVQSRELGTRMRLNLFSSTQPVRLWAWLIGVLIAVISAIILVAEAVGES